MLHYATPELGKDDSVLVQDLLGGPRGRTVGKKGAQLICARRKNSKIATVAMAGMFGVLTGSTAPVVLWHRRQEETGSSAE